MQTAVVEAVQRDRDIVELLQSGARDAAFDHLLMRYESKVYRLCCALLREPSQAQDAAQESFVRIWKALPSYDERASLSTWIYTIARNRCLTAIERRRAMESLSDAEVAREVESVQAENEDATQDHQRLLAELVGLLPERYRRVLTLFYYEDRSVAQVGEMLGMPEGTVKTSLFRARAALLEQLRRRGLDDATLWLAGDGP